MDCSGWDMACALAETVDPLRAQLVVAIKFWIGGGQSLLNSLGIEPHHLVTLAGVSFGAFKWWQSRESVIYKKLATILDEQNTRLKHARADAIGLLNRPAPSEYTGGPLYILKQLRRTLLRRRWQPVLLSVGVVTKTEEKLDRTLERLERQQKVLDGYQALYLQQRFSALLLQGAISSARAGLKRHAHNSTALRASASAKLRSALGVQGFEDDPACLELLGMQLLEEKHWELARDEFLKIVVTAGDPDAWSRRKRMQVVRAQRYQAQSHYLENQAKQNGTGGLGVATGLLIQAVNNLPSGTLLRWDLLDKAQVHELHALVRFGLANAANAAQGSLVLAEDAFAILEQQSQSIPLRSRFNVWKYLRSRSYQNARKKLHSHAVLGLTSCAEIRSLNGLAVRVLVKNS